MAWTVTIEDGEYLVTDHNGDERARLSGDSISTDDVKDVMHDRASTLKQEAEDAANNGRAPVAIETLAEWMTIIEDMAGDQIELPDGGT